MNLTRITARTALIPLVATLAFGSVQAVEAKKSAQQCPDGTKLVLVQITETADGYLATMRSQLGDSFKELERSIAKGKQNEIQAQNEAITSMKALVKLAEQDNIRLKEASAKKNKDEASHQLVKICLASGKVNELFNQVRSAGGVVDVLMTEVERKMEHSPSLPVSRALSESFTETFGAESVTPVTDSFVSSYN